MSEYNNFLFVEPPEGPGDYRPANVPLAHAPYPFISAWDIATLYEKFKRREMFAEWARQGGDLPMNNYVGATRAKVSRFFKSNTTSVAPPGPYDAPDAQDQQGAVHLPELLTDINKFLTCGVGDVADVSYFLDPTATIDYENWNTSGSLIQASSGGRAGSGGTHVIPGSYNYTLTKETIPTEVLFRAMDDGRYAHPLKAITYTENDETGEHTFHASIPQWYHWVDPNDTDTHSYSYSGAVVLRKWGEYEGSAFPYHREGCFLFDFGYDTTSYHYDGTTVIDLNSKYITRHPLSEGLAPGLLSGAPSTDRYITTYPCSPKLKLSGFDPPVYSCWSFSDGSGKTLTEVASIGPDDLENRAMLAYFIPPAVAPTLRGCYGAMDNSLAFNFPPRDNWSPTNNAIYDIYMSLGGWAANFALEEGRYSYVSNRNLSPYLYANSICHAATILNRLNTICLKIPAFACHFNSSVDTVLQSTEAYRQDPPSVTFFRRYTGSVTGDTVLDMTSTSTVQVVQDANLVPTGLSFSTDMPSANPASCSYTFKEINFFGDPYTYEHLTTIYSPRQCILSSMTPVLETSIGYKKYQGSFSKYSSAGGTPTTTTLDADTSGSKQITPLVPAWLTPFIDIQNSYVYLVRKSQVTAWATGTGSNSFRYRDGGAGVSGSGSTSSGNLSTQSDILVKRCVTRHGVKLSDGKLVIDEDPWDLAGNFLTGSFTAPSNCTISADGTITAVETRETYTVTSSGVSRLCDATVNVTAFLVLKLNPDANVTWS